nr:hypothetical protein [Rubrobacteraceae bacterium]
RRKRAQRGGKGKAAKRVSILWDEVRAVIEGVETERLSPPQANSMVRAYGTLIALERLRIEESDLEIAQRRLALDEEERTEIRARLEELEEALQRQKGEWRYGA